MDSVGRRSFEPIYPWRQCGDMMLFNNSDLSPLNEQSHEISSPGLREGKLPSCSSHTAIIRTQNCSRMLSSSLWGLQVLIIIHTRHVFHHVQCPTHNSATQKVPASQGNRVSPWLIILLHLPTKNSPFACLFRLNTL